MFECLNVYMFEHLNVSIRQARTAQAVRGVDNQGHVADPGGGGDEVAYEACDGVLWERGAGKLVKHRTVAAEEEQAGGRWRSEPCSCLGGVGDVGAPDQRLAANYLVTASVRWEPLPMMYRARDCAGFEPNIYVINHPRRARQ